MSALAYRTDTQIVAGLAMRLAHATEHKPARTKPEQHLRKSVRREYRDDMALGLLGVVRTHDSYEV